MTNEDHPRVAELEIKLTYQEQRIADLDETVLAQSRRIDEIEDTLKAVKTALLRLRAESGSGGEVLGAYPDEDPVPSSG